MDLLSEGQKLTLIFQKESNMVEMTCDIERVHDDRIDVSLPQYFMRYIDFLQVGRKLTAKVFSKVGTIDFNTVVIYSPLEETFTIELDYNSVKITPGTELPVVNSAELLEVEENKQRTSYKTFELSNEHLKFYSENKFQLNQSIDGALLLPSDYGTITFRAIVTEIDPIYDNEYTAKFSTMSEENRQTLLFYLYMYSKNYNQE